MFTEGNKISDFQNVDAETSMTTSGTTNKSCDTVLFSSTMNILMGTSGSDDGKVATGGEQIRSVTINSTGGFLGLTRTRFSAASFSVVPKVPEIQEPGTLGLSWNRPDRSRWDGETQTQEKIEGFN